MHSRLTRLGLVIARLALLIQIGSFGCSAARDERLPSERLLSGCLDDGQCGANELCQAGRCVSLDSVHIVTGKVVGAPASVSVTSQTVGDEVCSAHPGQGLICTLAPGGRVVLLAPAVPGYRFVGWTGERCQGSATTLELARVEQDTVCVAEYTQRLRVSGTVEGQPGLTLSASSDRAEANCQDNVCEVDAHTPVVLSAPVRDGQRITGFEGSGCESSQGYQVTVTPTDHDLTCSAKYAPAVTARGQARGLPPQALLGSIVASSVAAGAQCSGPLCSIDPGGDVTLQASVVDRYRFSGWTGEERCLGDDAARSLRALTSSVVCTADYVSRTSVQVVSEPALAPPGALRALSATPFAVCSGPSCDVDSGQDVTLIAGTVPGYKRDHWSGGGCEQSSGAAAVARAVSVDTTCTAHYVPGVSVTGTVLNAVAEVDARSSSGNASCSHGSCSIDPAGSVTLTAPSLPGRTFLGWSGDEGCSGSAATLTLANVTSSKNCFASFAPRYAVVGRALPAAGGSTRASSPSATASCADNRCELDSGSAAALQSSSNPGFRFSGWSGPGCVGTEPALKFPSVTGDVACKANFIARVQVTADVAPERTGAVTAHATAATAVCSGASCTVDEGGAVELSAQPAEGYRFTHWSGCGEPVTSSTLALLGASVSQRCTANFEKLTFPVSALATAGGTVSASSGGGRCPGATCTVSFGDGATLEAVPATGYTFVGWADCSSASATLVLPSVHAATTCTATFARIRVTLSGISVPAGAGSVLASSSTPGASCAAGLCTVDYGSDAQLTADPDPKGYRFDSWSGCMGGQLSGTTLSFAGLTSNTSCQASYIKRWTVTARANTAAGGTTNCATGCAVDQGASVTLMAVPAALHTLTGWSCTPAVSESITLPNVSADITCIAQFQASPM